ncbi:response regulator transcription factor [Paraburkholderia sp. IW21]|uniref:response regulator transcription factor n=1 Tax=Paraburkholderia sp. IW21 TaxID=3242488 RepID=UPI0035218B55
MPDRNFSFMAAHDVIALSQDLFIKSGINCFSYSRVYPDRSRAELWTDPNALRHTFLIKKYIVGAYTPACYTEEERYSLLDSKIETFPPNIRERYANQVNDQRILFDHASPFKIINKTDDWCEYFIFYAPVRNRSIIGFYINNLELLEKFAVFFRDSAKKLIQQASDDRIIRAVRASCQTKQALPALSLASGPLTPRQLEIARLVVAGRTAREISQQLDVSRRTIETHIENMKSKLGCMNKTELILRFSDLGISESS